jgi:PAS domain S-box-containing protein
VTGASLPPLNEKRSSPADGLALARSALEQTSDRHGASRAARVAIWHWDLASGRVEWDPRLKALFGYAETVTDAAWRENRMHPEDRERVMVSLQRATIVNHGAVWSEQYRFRQANGRYVSVTERAYVLNDEEGPCGVLGGIAPVQARALQRRSREQWSPSPSPSRP